MSKTEFANGIIVQPEWLNSIYHTDGGHVHDGGEEDGHAPKIDLATSVKGLLSLTNIADFVKVYTIPVFVYGTEHNTHNQIGMLGIAILYTTTGARIVFCEPAVGFNGLILSQAAPGNIFQWAELDLPNDALLVNVDIPMHINKPDAVRRVTLLSLNSQPHTNRAIIYLTLHPPGESGYWPGLELGLLSFHYFTGTMPEPS